MKKNNKFMGFKLNKKKSFSIFSIFILVLFTFVIGNFLDISYANNYEENKYQTNDLNNNKDLIIHFIDVGQGDSIFIELSNDQTMLIDAGESSKENIVFDYINNLGYSKIDYVVGTHPHTDHIGGLAYIINNFDIGNIYMPKATSTSKTYENLLNTILLKGLSIKTAKVGLNIYNKDNLKIEIISPIKDNYSSLNNYSAVVKITYKNNEFLFMGDAEELIENEINSDINVDLIKVGHHGSNTSSSQSFVNKVRPKYAIISVGEDNRYNHPHQEIVDRWYDVGAKIYRTDLNGNIVVKSNGIDITVLTDR